MKITHVITGLSQGGAEGTLVRLVCQSHQPSAHTVISLMDEGIHGAKLRASGARVVSLGGRRGSFSISAFHRLIAEIREAKPDVVQTWMYHADLLGGLAAKQLGIPVIWGVRMSNNALSDLGFKTWLVAKACAMLSRVIPRSIVSCSQRSIGLHRKFGYADRFVYIPNGFQIDTANALNTKNSVHSPVVFGHAARLHPMKDHAGLMQAFTVLKSKAISCRLALVGTGVSFSNPEFSALVPDAVRTDVSATGPQSDMSGFYAGLDCFIMSSAWGEAFPNVVAEAMLAGVPCIVTDVGDAAEIVGDTGWAVPPKDPQALAEAMAQALTAMADTDAWTARKAAAWARIVAEYSMDKMQTRFEAAWKAAMEN